MPLYPPASGAGGGGIPEAPADGTLYVRSNGAWAQRFIALPQIAGNWYPSDIGVTTSTGANIATNIIRYSIVVLYQPVTITDLAVRITTAVVGNFQLALYAANYATGAPRGSPLVQTGAISVPSTTAGLFSGPVTTPTLIPAGVYWFGINADTTGMICQIATIATGAASAYFGSPTLSDVSITATTATYSYNQNQFYGTWPDAAAATRVASTAGANSVAMCLYKVG